jgi:hemin uptake protein HemP
MKIHSNIRVFRRSHKWKGRKLFPKGSAMEIHALYGVSQTMPIDPALKSRDNADAQQAVVAAVRALNRSELLGSDRELQFTRDSQTQRMVIQIVDRQSGAVLDQLPPEEVLRILANLGQPVKK